MLTRANIKENLALIQFVTARQTFFENMLAGNPDGGQKLGRVDQRFGLLQSLQEDHTSLVDALEVTAFLGKTQ